jgi:uncharacterized membrane protein
MSIFLRALRLITIVIWVGGLIFFAFVLAPLAFQTLPSTHDAGLIVGATLRALNELGYACGFLFLFATAALWSRSGPRARRLLIAQLLLIVLMLLATFDVQSSIIPAMERDRIAAGGDIEAAPAASPSRIDFDRLHALSEKVEGSALLFGFGLVVLMAFEKTTP